VLELVLELELELGLELGLGLGTQPQCTQNTMGYLMPQAFLSRRAVS